MAWHPLGMGDAIVRCQLSTQGGQRPFKIRVGEEEVWRDDAKVLTMLASVIRALEVNDLQLLPGGMPVGG